jgi:lipopolysaccharide export system protein LptA
MHKVFASPALLIVAALPLLAAPNPHAAAPPAATPPAARPAVPLTPIQIAAAKGAHAPPPIKEKEMMDALNSSYAGGAPLTTLRKHEAAHKDANGGPDVPTSGTTEVSSDIGAFDQKAHVAIFTKNVYVESPQFTVTCEKLTAYMRQAGPKPDAASAPGKPGAAATPAATPKATPAIAAGSAPGATPAPADAKPKAGGLEKAVCEGSVVIIQDKIDPDGTLTRNLGHAQKAIYHADTGDIYLFGSPDIQQGQNTCTALEDSTVMVLNRDGHMTVNGLHRSVIKDSGQPNSDNGKD